MTQVIETSYPITFRQADAATLGQHLLQHNSVSLIGMKRVGISNFLRFFINHPQTKPTYLKNDQHLFIVVDLNNLVEINLYAFWMLTLKRIVDAIEVGAFSAEIKKQTQATFIQSIQLGDFFFTLESVRKLIRLLVNQDKYVTIFFVRFDRLQEAVTTEFFANIQSLKENGDHLSYVFTSFRPLHEIVPTVFTRAALSGFSEEMFLQPAVTEMKSILSTFQERYKLDLSPKVAQTVLQLSGGHVQYLHLMLIKLKNEKIDEAVLASEVLLQNLFAQDEEIHFLSEELFSSLTPVEQDILTNAGHEPPTKQELTAARYLWDTGVCLPHSTSLFNPLFCAYLQEVKNRQRHSPDFTKKENLLFSLLQSNEGKLVERDTIIEAVWPDEVELGVSDWSIDRLVSRVRVKLKNQNSDYRILTVITRGYKLVKKN
jgi:hypothetical protein